MLNDDDEDPIEATPRPTLKRKVTPSKTLALEPFQPPKKVQSTPLIDLISSDDEKGESVGFDGDEERSEDSRSFSHPSFIGSSVDLGDLASQVAYTAKKKLGRKRARRLDQAIARLEAEHDERRQRNLSGSLGSGYRSEDQAQPVGTPPDSPRTPPGSHAPTQPLDDGEADGNGANEVPLAELQDANGNPNPAALDLEAFKEDETRVRCKNLCITVPQIGDITLASMAQRIETFAWGQSQPSHYILVGEWHRDVDDNGNRLKHAHSYLKFQNPRGQISFSTLDQIFGIPHPTNVATFRRNNYQKVKSPAKWLNYCLKSQTTEAPPYPLICRRYTPTGWQDFDPEVWLLQLGGTKKSGRMENILDHLFHHPNDMVGAAKVDPTTFGSRFRTVKDANHAYNCLTMFDNRLDWVPIPPLAFNGTEDIEVHQSLANYLNKRVPQLKQGLQPHKKNNVIVLVGEKDIHKSALTDWLARYVSLQTLDANPNFPWNGINELVEPALVAYQGFDPKDFTWAYLEKIFDSSPTRTVNSKGSSFHPTRRYQYIIDTNIHPKYWFREKYFAMDERGNLVDKYRDQLTPAQREALYRRLAIFDLKTPITFFPDPEGNDPEKYCDDIAPPAFIDDL